MLNSNYYTIKNALNYQMFVGHYKEAVNPKGSWGSRIVHVIMAALEVTPIIGQLIALFELAVLKAFGLKDSSKVSNTSIFMNTAKTPNGLLYAFYQGAGKDIKGRTLKEIWAFDDAEKESAHDYIQWLFPSSKASQFNPDSPVLAGAKGPDGKQSLLDVLRKDPKVVSNLKQSFEVMLKFYGLHYDQTSKTVIKNSNFNTRTKVWLTPGNHNFLRLSRILDCLVKFGLNDEAKAFLNQLKDIKDSDSNSPITESNFKYWSQAAAQP